MASSKYADEGSAAHYVAALCLTSNTNAVAYIGRLIELEDYEHAGLSPSGAHKWMACVGSFTLEAIAEGEFVERCYSVEFTEEMAEYTQAYIDAVRQRVEEYRLAGAVEVTLLVEQRLPIAQITGEKNATGTGDAIIIAVWPDGTALADVGDLKTGQGVEVRAENNEQLQMYALGVIEEHGLLYDFTKARLTIYQPRVRQVPDEWERTVEQLREFEALARDRAKLAHVAKAYAANWINGPDYSYLTAGEHCKNSFCSALQRSICPKADQYVQEAVGAGFEVIVDHAQATGENPLGPNWHDEASLGAKMAACDLIEAWIKAVRAEVERRLLAGVPVPGFKLVQGKKGARAWSDAEAVEKLMRESMRLRIEDVYDMKLISPTSAEKLAKAETIKPRQWTKLEAFITQSEGKASVAPESDKRPALVIAPTAGDFDVVADDLVG